MLFPRHDESLPEHLRVYTAGSVWVRVLTLGVELLQFVKDYTAATHQLKALLAQTVYHPDYRGRWYDRLTLNLDHHLKERHKVSSVNVDISNSHHAYTSCLVKTNTDFSRETSTVNFSNIVVHC